MPDQAEKVILGFSEIAQRLKATNLPEVDAVVGIQTGGRVPAALCAYELGVPLFMLPIHFRDPDNHPEHDAPVVFSEDFVLPPAGARLLLVDDVSVSGQTLQAARKVLGEQYASVVTLTLKGKADIVLFPEVKRCVRWPWH